MSEETHNIKTSDKFPQEDANLASSPSLSPTPPPKNLELKSSQTTNEQTESEILKELQTLSNNFSSLEEVSFHQITKFQANQQIAFFKLASKELEAGISYSSKFECLGNILIGISLSLFSLSAIVSFVTVFLDTKKLSDHNDQINFCIAVLICGIFFRIIAAIVVYYFSRKANGLETLKEHFDISYRLMFANQVYKDIDELECKKEAQLIIIKALLEVESKEKEENEKKQEKNLDTTPANTENKSTDETNAKKNK